MRIVGMVAVAAGGASALFAPQIFSNSKLTGGAVLAPDEIMMIRAAGGIVALIGAYLIVRRR